MNPTNKQFRLFLSMILLLVIGISCDQTSINTGIELPGVKQAVINLNGTWKFNMTPPAEFWKEDTEFSDWENIKVPGECQMQGFPIKHDIAYAYKYEFNIPADFKDKDIFLVFHGVYSQARIWVNGEFAGEHTGGFTKWDCNISPFVEAGGSAVLTVEIVDRTDDVSYAAGYAKHQIGGILRNVELTALPATHFTRLNFDTKLDDTYTDAKLLISYELSNDTEAEVQIELFDAEGTLVKSSSQKAVPGGSDIIIPVQAPKKWDAEHPNLYKITTSLIQDGGKTISINDRIGFREVVVEGNKLLVNGKEVKLRGADRHDIHPTLGRVSTPEYELKDVLLAKESNMNFIRTSHYPPTEGFLDLCDEYGLYVEDEAPVCFVGTHRTKNYRSTGATENDSQFTENYLKQTSEMVETHRNHPSVIIWSIGNENHFGENFVNTYKWVKENDPSRPVIFSYPGKVPADVELYDIISMHYPDWNGNMIQYDIETKNFGRQDKPVLHDEMAHVSCYNNYELIDDPNVRNYWGQGLDSMWMNLFVSDGGLGGAIWCMIDETFMLPEGMEGFNDWWGILDSTVIPATFIEPSVGYGEWGVIDTWRRKKPEFWGTKKAYSPTKIYMRHIMDFTAHSPLEVDIHNRFDHTNFNEIDISWGYGEQSGVLSPVDIEPHAYGKLTIPAADWKEGEMLNLTFHDKDKNLIDEYNLRLGELSHEMPALAEGELKSEESEKGIKLSAENISMFVNKETGMIENLVSNNDTMIISGPYLHLTYPGKARQFSTFPMIDHAEEGQCKGFEFEINNGIALIHSNIDYNGILADIHIKADKNGLINIDYKISNMKAAKPVQEAGLKFITGNSFSGLSWDREGYFSAYPADHMGRNKGNVSFNDRQAMKYREEPAHSWAKDIMGFYYFGAHTQLEYSNEARGMKENIYNYTLSTEAGNSLEVLSDGTQACRFNKTNGINTLVANQIWTYNSLMWGNYYKDLGGIKELKGNLVLRLK